MEKGKNFSLNKVDDFTVVEISTKKSSGKQKNNYVVSRTENQKPKTKKTLSVVDDYIEFDFRANRAQKSDVKSAESATISAKKSCGRKKTVAKMSKEPVVTVEKNTEGSIRLEKSDLERHIMKVAEASERFDTDDAASRVILVARMGSLFGCVK